MGIKHIKLRSEPDRPAIIGMGSSSCRGVRILSKLSVAAIFLWLISSANTAMSQELSPRAFWPAPKGTNALVISYQHQTGDVLTDPTLPISGVDSRINYLATTYQKTLGLFGRTANLLISVPYTQSTTTGILEGQFARRDFSDMGDSRIQLSINLKGAPSMSVQEFQELRRQPRTIIGASLLIQPPTGAYDEEFLINAGTNRWAAKLGLGIIWPIRPTWLLEADIGAWFFSDNDEFLGNTREQDPIASVAFHLIKRIKPGFWASLDANYYRGGESTIGGEKRSDLQRNSRFGGTIVFPFMKQHAIKLSYSTGIVTASGGDFDMYSVNYLFAWR